MSRTRGFLPIAVSEDPYRLVRTPVTGDPVWPVSTDSERSSLQRLAKTFSCDLRPITPQAGRTSETRHGSVVGLGKETWQEAELYAHLTRRRFRPLSSCQDLEREENLSVLVTLRSALTVQFIEQFFERCSGENFPGIIFGSNHEDLRKQVLLRSAPLELFDPCSAFCARIKSIQQNLLSMAYEKVFRALRR